MTNREPSRHVTTLETRLEISETRHRTLLENIRDGVYTLDTDGRFTFVNEVIVKRSGQSAEWFLNRSYLDVIRVEDRARVRAHFESVMQGKTVPVYELAYSTAAGEDQWVEVNTAPLFENGRVIGLFGVSRDINKRKRLESELQKNEEKYRRLVEDSIDGIAIVEDFDIQFVNPAMCRMFGFEKKSDMIGQDFTRLISPEHRNRLAGFGYTGEKEPHAPRRYTFKTLRKNGTTFQSEISISAIAFDGGTAQQVIIRDITERLRVKKALRETDERYRLLVETMSDGLGIQDENGLITFVNDKFCSMLKYQSDEFIGRPVTDFLDPANTQILKKQIGKRKKGLAEPYELHWTRRDGSLFPTIMSPQAIYDTDGRFMGSFAVITDISEQKNAEAALHRALEETERRVGERTKELQIKTNMLEDINTALNILLKKRDEEKTDVEKRNLANEKTLILPYIAKIKKGELDTRVQALIGIIESNLNEIISPFTLRLSSDYFGLTPAEIKVADLVRRGKKTKEIAEILNLSHKTIECHRENIRKKMGLKHKKVNLRTYLLSLH